MLHLIIQCFTLLFITASFIIQMLVLLGNFPGLRSVYITRIELDAISGSTNTLVQKLSKRYFTSIPDYFTVSILRLCEGYNDDSSKNICSPASLGFRYQSSDELLDTFQSQLPPSMKSEFAGIQGGVFIVSVLLCFLLLVYYLYHQFIERRRRLGWCWIILALVLCLLTLVFAIATFVIQLYVHQLVRNALSNLTGSFLGNLFSEFVNIVVTTGPSVWLSLVSLILLFLTFVLLCISMCCINRRKRERTETTSNRYDMRST